MNASFAVSTNQKAKLEGRRLGSDRQAMHTAQILLTVPLSITVLLCSGQISLASSRKNDSAIPGLMSRHSLLDATKAGTEAPVPDPFEHLPSHMAGSDSIEAVITGRANFDDQERECLRHSGVVTSPASGGNNLVMLGGNLLVDCTNKVDLSLLGAEVAIAPGAIVYVRDNGTSVAIFNLHDEHRDSVSVTVGGSRHCLAPGRMVVLSRMPNETFEQANPCPGVWFRTIAELPVEAGSMRAYETPFSLWSTYYILPVVRRFSRVHKAHGDKIIKTVASVYAISRDRQEFRPHTQDKSLRSVAAQSQSKKKNK